MLRLRFKCLHDNLHEATSITLLARAILRHTIGNWGYTTHWNIDFLCGMKLNLEQRLIVYKR